jgi:hypothetical protein
MKDSVGRPIERGETLDIRNRKAGDLHDPVRREARQYFAL